MAHHRGNWLMQRDKKAALIRWGQLLHQMAGPGKARSTTSSKVPLPTQQVAARDATPTQHTLANLTPSTQSEPSTNALSIQPAPSTNATTI
ncbi:uncharacterized protein LOC114310668 isoform X2 [Camellia sinensis]|uniref:uncharacterized protein LOC114310668 isoform X2 n=1 Tax=Camellia sinensis TaxID=4442 RepID=UPI0010365DD0|nr:uncharacterized protein LOC114310668 isoform X2 [Camellia sinensis]